MNKLREYVEERVTYLLFCDATGMGLVSFHMGQTELHIHLMAMVWSPHLLSIRAKHSSGPDMFRPKSRLPNLQCFELR